MLEELEYTDRYPHLAAKEVLTWPHSALTVTATVVPDDFPPAELEWITNRMLEIVRERKAIGLAAPQVGIPLRVFVMIHEGRDHVFINPVWGADKDATQKVVDEACLSFPGVVDQTKRWSKVRVEHRYMGLRNKFLAGKATTFFEGLAAQCVQHEVEHLDGVTFYSRMGRVKRDIFKRKARKAARRAGL